MIERLGWLAETIYHDGRVPRAAIRAARRQRWLIGAILAGVAGLLLMIAAILRLRRHR